MFSHREGGSCFGDGPGLSYLGAWCWEAGDTGFPTEALGQLGGPGGALSWGKYMMYRALKKKKMFVCFSVCLYTHVHAYICVPEGLCVHACDLCVCLYDLK